jgi:S-phase kinase-associated protein 1
MTEFAAAAAPEREVILISGDGDEYRVSLKIAGMSTLVNTMLGEEADAEEKRAPLPGVKKEVLSKVLEYCTHYIDEPMTELFKVKVFFA